MSLRRYLGWEPATITTRDGHTWPEPEYDGWERTIQEAYDAWCADHCPGCGQLLDECLLDKTVPPAQRIHYRAGFVECMGCAALEQANDEQAARDDEWAKANPNQTRPTHHRRWVVTRIPQRG